MFAKVTSTQFPRRLTFLDPDRSGGDAPPSAFSRSSFLRERVRAMKIGLPERDGNPEGGGG